MLEIPEDLGGRPGSKGGGKTGRGPQGFRYFPPLEKEIEMSKWKFGNVQRKSANGLSEWSGPFRNPAGLLDERNATADIAEELAEMLEGIVEGKGIRTYGDARALLDRFRVQEEQTVEAKLAVLSKQCAWDDINANMVYLAQAIDALRAEVRGK
jgi:hypothetical protein